MPKLEAARNRALSAAFWPKGAPPAPGLEMGVARAVKLKGLPVGAKHAKPGIGPLQAADQAHGTPLACVSASKAAALASGTAATIS